MSSHDLGQEAYDFAIAVHAKRFVYMIGGCLIEGCPIKKVFIFDIRSSSWAKAAELNEGRFAHTSIAFVDKLYVFGGSTSLNGELLGSIEMLQIGSD